MRKRIVISVLVLVLVIGGGIAALVFRPWESPLEQHKREYLRAQHWGIVDEGVFRYASQEWKTARMERKEQRIERHRKALLELGYLEERSVVLYNRGALDVLSNVVEMIGTNNVQGLDEDFLSFDKTSFVNTETNVVRFVAVKRDVRTWEELIRKADVPQSGN